MTAASTRKSVSLKGKADRVGDYDLHQVLGEGSFGKVKVGRHVRSKDLFAVKIVGKCSISDIEEAERVYRETAILTTLRHENVIRLCEVIDTSSKVYLVMEFARGGELLDYISEQRVLSERETCRIVHQMVDGIDYCHKKNVIHRDLKLENVLLDENGRIKIADFGLSNSIKFGQKMGTDCGTPSYTSPEQISSRSQVGAATDVWSLGVMVFTMMCGFLPFVGSSARQIFRKIVAGQFLIPDFISDEGRDFLKSMLTTDVEDRITIHSIRAHNWFLMEYSDLADQLSQPPTLEQVDEAVKQRDKFDEEQRALQHREKKDKGSTDSAAAETPGKRGKKHDTTSITITSAEPEDARGRATTTRIRRSRSPSAHASKVSPSKSVVGGRRGRLSPAEEALMRSSSLPSNLEAPKDPPAPLSRSKTAGVRPVRGRSPARSPRSTLSTSSGQAKSLMKRSPSFNARRQASTPDLSNSTPSKNSKLKSSIPFSKSTTSTQRSTEKDCSTNRGTTLGGAGSPKKEKSAAPFSKAKRGREGATFWQPR